jgi:uncharacterized protein (TIGR03083 family)
VLQALDGLTPASVEQPGVCGDWSVRQIIAHLASYELTLLDVLRQLAGESTNGYVARYTKPDSDFNTSEVGARQSLTWQATLDELAATHERCLASLDKIPSATLAQTGAIPWYGAAYAVDDYIVYANYGHKREHCAQIDRFRAELRA